MSTYSDIIDEVIEDLQLYVDGLQVDAVVVHKYAPQDISRLVDDGAAHLAVYPNGEAPENIPGPLSTGSNDLVEEFRIMYWEGGGSETERGVADEEAAAAFLDRLDAIRDRFHVISNQARGGSWMISWIGARISTGGGQDFGFVRYFECVFRARIAYAWAT